VGQLETTYNWGFDWDWFIRAGYIASPHYIPETLAMARVTDDTKTMSGGAARRAEVASISRHHGGFWQPTNMVWLARRFGEITGSWLSPFLPSRVQALFNKQIYALYRLLITHYRGRYQE